MKRITIILSFLTFAALFLMAVEHLGEVEQPQQHSAYPSDAVEGTEENPLARLEYDWERLHDPATGRIPDGIAERELAFARSLAKHSTAPSLTRSEDWVARGPSNIGGRTRALAIDVTNENNILAGSTSSGVFKSTNGGNTWVKTTAPNHLHSLTSIVQNTSPGHENVWYYGTGDACTDGIYWLWRGDGIYKSTDSGESWNPLPATVSGTPHEADAFDVVCSLTTFGEDGVVAGTLTGIHRSVDGGASWEQTLALEGERLYWNSYVERTPGGTPYATVGGGGPKNGVYRSTDQGQSWENITPVDWPDATVKTVIEPVASNDNEVYFFTSVERHRQQLRKYEVGAGWTDLSAGLPFNGQMETFGGSLLVLSIRPDDPNVIFVGGVDLLRSTDGGQTFELVSGHGGSFHVDQTAIAFSPSNPNRMIVGNDGGLFRTDNSAGPTTDDKLDWQSLNNGYRTTQFYTVAVDPGTPGSNLVMGGSQDNGVIRSPSNPSDPWEIVYGGDGAFTAITDGGTYAYFASAATFRLYRQSGSELTGIAPEGAGLGLWLTIFQLDAHDQKIMYLPSQRTLWRNSDLTAIPHMQGVPTTTVNWDTFENVKDHYIHSLGMSPAAPRRLYYSAADISSQADEKVFYLDNPHEGQPVPVDITGENFPLFPWVPDIVCIAVDPRDVDKLVVVFPNYNVLSMFATEDGGQTWVPVSGNLEENPDGTGGGPSVNWLSILYVQDQPVYLAATSTGLFSSTELDGMNTIWRPEATGSIGNIKVNQIAVRQSDGFVAAATWGNGVYTTYITTVPTSTEDGIEQPGAFEVAAAYPNPFVTSTTIPYRLPAAGTVSASVFDVRGRKIETLFEGTQQAGEHQLHWDGARAADGVYFMRIDFGDTSRTEKVVLQR